MPGINTPNVTSTQTALSNPASLAPGSLGQDDLGGLLTSDDQTINLGNSVDSAYSTGTSAIDSSLGGSSATSGLGSDLSSILSGISGSGLGTLAEYGGLYGLLASQASSTQSQNNQLAGQMEGIGQPLVTEGQGLTSAFGQGKLTTPYQQQVTAAELANQNNATSQDQQVARLLSNSGGGQNVQGAQASESQQIQNAQVQANTNAISQAFQNELTSGMGLVGTGGSFVQSGIQQEIASNTALQQQLSQLMGTLANAYAKQTSGSGGSGTPTGSLGSMLSKLLGGGGGSGGVTGLGGIDSGTQSSIAGMGNAAEASGDINAGLDSNSIDNAINADSLANLNSASNGLSGLNNASISLGDLTSSEASDAGGVAGDIGDFSMGGSSAAASTLPAAAGGASSASSAGGSALGVAGSAVGDALGIGGAIMNPGNAGADINGTVAAYNLGSTIAGGDTLGASLGASLGISAGLATAGIGAVALGIEALVTSMTKPNNPDRINVAGAEAEGLTVNPLGKLPSGNSVLFDNTFGVGAGTQSSKGSGEIYQLQPKGSAANNSAYQWIGQADSTNLENDAHNLAAEEKANDATSNPAVQRTLGGIQSIFNQTGGEKGWGMSEQEFVQSMMGTLESGVYSSGNAFGRGN